MTVATLIGFDDALVDRSAGLQLCLPVLSFGSDREFYVAKKIDWNVNFADLGSGLTAVDEDELEGYTTMLPVHRWRAIEPGQGVLVVGGDFTRDVKDMGVDLPMLSSMMTLPNEGYATTVMTIESFRHFRTALCRAVSVVFDEALGSSGSHGLSFRGRAAMRILQQSAYRQTDLAVRELAAAVAVCDFDILRRLLARYSIELQESEDELEAKAHRHIGLCRRVQTNAAAYDSVRRMEWSDDRSPVHLVAKRKSMYVVEFQLESPPDDVGRARESIGLPVSKCRIDHSMGSKEGSGKRYYGSNRDVSISKFGDGLGQRKGYQYMKNKAGKGLGDYLLGTV